MKIYRHERGLLFIGKPQDIVTLLKRMSHVHLTVYDLLAKDSNDVPICIYSKNILPSKMNDGF
ncbi:Z-ring formation inhibitor MciZ [Aeribacillus alveayuensis]|uniref:Uncharacterized protein n=1 Tax=Aeribacillus alveayuensis TaxID=279215 RepID=A0ABT9VKS7_9BACI|nr:hypothetical protein [Bacillus alveayuensis]MDQ0161450.1 hypothetical protein [Bacillus alveayuensis]